MTAGTYFDYFKNGQDGHALCQQGLAFIMLVAGLIECEVRSNVERLGIGLQCNVQPPHPCLALSKTVVDHLAVAVVVSLEGRGGRGYWNADGQRAPRHEA